MILTADYHTHTVFSHGKGTILDNAAAAKEKGLKTIAITDHGFSHPAFGMRRRELPEMREKINEAISVTGVNVLLGTESNILGVDGKTDVKVKDYEKLDIFLSGIHRFIYYDKLYEWFKLLGANYFARKFKKGAGEKLIKRNTLVYINAIKNNPIDILTHPNFLVFANAEEVAECCRDYGTYFEINSRKTHLTFDEWEKVIATGVDFVVDSDAHIPENVGNVSLGFEVIKGHNIPLSRIKNIDGREPERFRFKEFKQKL